MRPRRRRARPTDFTKVIEGLARVADQVQRLREWEAAREYLRAQESAHARKGEAKEAQRKAQDGHPRDDEIPDETVR